ncbi:MAG: hypothetical protein RR048_03325 [Oscillospiraceae bacterium]
MKRIMYIISVICLCVCLVACGKSNEKEENEGENQISPIQQEVVTFDKDINVTYGNAVGNLPMSEDDDNYYFMNAPRVNIVPKDGGETSGFKIFTDKCDIKKFIIYDNNILVVNDEDGLVTCDTMGNNISIKKYNDKKILDIYIEGDVVYFLTVGDEEDTTDIYSKNISSNDEYEYEQDETEDDEIKSEVELIATINVAASSISDFAALGTDVYITYQDEYQMQVLMKINGIAQLPLQSLPPEFCQKNKAFTDGGYIYMSSSINKIVRYDVLNNTVAEIATVGEPINAKNGFIYIVNQTSLKDVEIICYNVKTQEATILYKNSENIINNEEYTDEDNTSVMIKSLGAFEDGEIIFVEEYTNSDGEQHSATYIIEDDGELKKI